MQYSWWWLIVGLLQSLLIRHTHYLGHTVNFNSRNIRIWLLMHFLSHLQSFRENKSNSTEIIGQFYLHSTLLNLPDKVVLKWFSTQSVVIFNRQLQSFLGRFSLLLKMLFRILFVDSAQAFKCSGRGNMILSSWHMVEWGMLAHILKKKRSLINDILLWSVLHTINGGHSF